MKQDTKELINLLVVVVVLTALSVVGVHLNTETMAKHNIKTTDILVGK